MNPTEEVVVELHPHWSVLIKPALATLVVGGGSVALLFVYPSAPVWVLGIFGVLIGAPLVWFALRWVQRSATIFVVTTERVALRGGIVVKKGWDIRLEKVNDVSFEQKLFERIFGVGDFWVDTGGEAGMKGMARMPHPEAVRQLVFEQCEIHNAGPGGSAVNQVPVTQTRIISNTGLSVAEQIEKLDELRSRGVLTDKEFDAEKSRLIGR